jgi:transcription-repair coupling factor (superfamily II helicase)
LTLRAALSGAAARAGLNNLAPSTAGLTPAAKALAVVAGARSASGITLLVVPTDRDVEQLTRDARFFYAALEGASESAVDAAVLGLPSLQVDPYRGMNPHFRVAAARARALHAAATGTARIVIASAASLLPKVGSVDRVLRASRAVAIGSEIDPQDLAALLIDAGFTREDPVEDHGSFTLRGGIVDVFPANDAAPVRLEFVGDMVESIRRFDPGTQRSTGATDQVVIVPVRETFDDEDPTLSVVDFFNLAAGVRVVVSEKDDVSQQARRVREQLQGSFEDAGARGHVAYRPPEQAFITWE